MLLACVVSFFFAGVVMRREGIKAREGEGEGGSLDGPIASTRYPVVPLFLSLPLSHPHALCLATTTAGSAAAYGIAAPRLASPRITAHHMATVVCMCSGTRQAAETDSNAGFGGTVHRFYSSADRIDLSHSAGSSESAQHSHHVVERKAAALAGSS